VASSKPVDQIEVPKVRVASKTAPVAATPAAETPKAVDPTVATDGFTRRPVETDTDKILAVIQQGQTSFEKQQLGHLKALSRDMQSNQSRSADELIARLKASMEQSFSQSQWKEEVVLPLYRLYMMPSL